MAYTVIGNTVVEWDDTKPLFFTMSEETGSKDDRRKKTVEFDLTGLQNNYEEQFLLNFKNLLVERGHRIALVSIETEFHQLRSLFNNIVICKLFDRQISIIDEAFLLALNTKFEKFSATCLLTFKRYYMANPQAHIFAQSLRDSDFPVKSNKKGFVGKTIDNILAKALTRTACVEILCKCDEAYEDDSIDIGFFSFVNLAFAVYVRPDSYRRIRISDLVYDTHSDAYFIYISPAKTGAAKPQKICYRINKNVGILLLKQRQHVIDKYGHLINEDDIGKLALFPSRKLKSDKSGWISKYANEFFGEYETGGQFSSCYFNRVRNMLGEGKYTLTATALRHTIGTQLAADGCSATTIQAVLKHATDNVCVAYVDIACQAMMNALSDALRPAFEAHLPVFERFQSKNDLLTPNKAIYSENLETGRIELTGECGKQIRCLAAPLTCYECNKFIPFFDADHTLNLDICQGDIDLYKHAGTPYRHLVEKAKRIKYSIQLVMAACEQYQQTGTAQKRQSL